MQRLRFRGLLFSCTLLTAIPTSAQPPEPVVPEGFTVQKVAGFPLLHRPIFAGFDETGVLYVGESSGENLKRDDMLAKKPHWITRLEDTDDDGVFDKSTKFVENITLPQGCLWYRGSLYAACPPSIWKFTDTDNDGKADQREEILTGFGFNGNACDTHGPFLSPTGRLYIAQGRHGHEFKDKDGHVYSKGKAGRIYSCRLDGSDVRVHCGGGFDNPVEIDFTEEGEAIGTVNILYRDRGDCLMHWVEGGVYPREDQADCVAEFKWTGGLLGPIHNLGHVACSGLMRYRGVHFGDGFKDRWFFTEFNTHKVRYAELRRAGSTFTADVHEFLTCADGDFHPTDVLEDADGSLLVLNTGGWFLNGCPTSRVAKPEIYGGVYRVRRTDGVKVDDPRGKQLQLAKKSPEVWIKHLDDQRPAVREQVIELFSQHVEERRVVIGPFHLDDYITDQLSTDEPETVYESINNAIWSFSRRASTRSVDLLSLADRIENDGHAPIPHVLVAAINMHDDAPDHSGYVEDLSYFACSDDAHLAAVMVRVLGRELEHATRHSKPRDEPGQVLERLGMETHERTVTLYLLSSVYNVPRDRFHEHSVIVSLTRGGNREVLQAALRETIPAVQRVALIALDQMDNSPLTQAMVIPLLSADDATLQQTALEVIARRPGWAAATLSLLKTWVREPELSADRANALRAFLLAQLGDPAVQGFVKEVLEDSETAGVVRGLVWEVVQRSTIATWPEGWNRAVTEALRSGDDVTQLAVLRIVQRRGLADFDAELTALSGEATKSALLRAEALATLGPRMNAVPDEQFLSLRKLLAKDAATADKMAAARALAVVPLDRDQLRTLAGDLDAAGPLTASTLLKAFERSNEDAVGAALVSALRESSVAETLSPDELAAVVRRYSPMVHQLALPLIKKLGIDVAAQQARLAELSPLIADGDAKAGERIFFEKRANCSACHAVAGKGARVGPDLSRIGQSRTGRDLLEAIVYPSASFVNGYRPYVVATNDGKVVDGVISAETTDSITLRTKDLQEVRLHRDAIDELRESSTSIMPKGLDTQLSADELRNLLAYLQSRK